MLHEQLYLPGPVLAQFEFLPQTVGVSVQTLMAVQSLPVALR